MLSKQARQRLSGLRSRIVLPIIGRIAPNLGLEWRKTASAALQEPHDPPAVFKTVANGWSASSSMYGRERRSCLARPLRRKPFSKRMPSSTASLSKFTGARLASGIQRCKAPTCSVRRVHPFRWRKATILPRRPFGPSRFRNGGEPRPLYFPKLRPAAMTLRRQNGDSHHPEGSHRVAF